LVIAEWLIELFPDSSEGEMAVRFNGLVRREMCARVAAETLGLGRYLLLGGSGGRRNTTILGDACEAVLGAIFLDGGFVEARRVIRHLWSDRVAENGDVAGDAKSALQEWAQGMALPLPSYTELAREGPDHSPVFTTEVRVEGFAPEVGTGVNKRAAEQAAAQAMLTREGVWTESENV
ncbi:MAG: putative dsRNA-binding protein, partial [Pseudomonadota bacterium]|nr:putative dsRNA-binding protein [Pseudomonadota bacterium]